MYAQQILIHAYSYSRKESREMSSINVSRIPVIDLSKQDEVEPGTAEWEMVKGQVRQALEEYGCFEAVFDPILELRNPLLAALEQLFDLPLQTKERFVSKKPFLGYTCGPSATLKEGMAIDDATIAGNIDRGLINSFWPQGNPSVSKTMACFAELSSGLERRIRRMILESFGVEKYMDEHMDFTTDILRMIKYRGRGEYSNVHPNPGAHAHIDQNMMTLLYQLNEVNGLEIQTKDGQCWINVQPSPNSFIVMVGESLSVWLNGGLWSPNHRVMMRGNKARYCAGLFATPKGGYQLKAPEEVVNDQNPLLFKPFDYDLFTTFYASQLARGAIGVETGLKAYCSVD